MNRSYEIFDDELAIVDGGKDWTALGIDMVRPPTILIEWPGVYSVPNGANVGTAADA